MFHVELLNSRRSRIQLITIIIITFISKMVTILKDKFSRHANPVIENYISKCKYALKKYPEKIQHYNPI